MKRDPLQTYLDAQRDHGDVVRFTAGPPGVRMQFYMVFSPEGAQQVLASLLPSPLTLVVPAQEEKEVWRSGE